MTEWMTPRNDPAYQGGLASYLLLNHSSFYILLAQPVGFPWLDFLNSFLCPASYYTFSMSPPHSQPTARVLPGLRAQLAGATTAAGLSCSPESLLWGMCRTKCVTHVLFKPENDTWITSPNKASYPPRALRSGLPSQTKERGAFSALCALLTRPPVLPWLCFPWSHSSAFTRNLPESNPPQPL